jgi:hypothetical protein
MTKVLFMQPTKNKELMQLALKGSLNRLIFYGAMEAINRIAASVDWISFILLPLAMACQVSFQHSLTEFLSVYTSSRFIKITRDDRIENYQLQQTGIIVHDRDFTNALQAFHDTRGFKLQNFFFLILTVVERFPLPSLFIKTNCDHWEL